MGKASTVRSILEDVRFDELYSQLPFNDLEFWEVYYRHNNFFLERNSTLLHKIKNNKNFVQASIMNNSSIGFEQFIEFFDTAQNSLSHIGIRVCSLMDIIRIQTALGLSLDTINRSVKDLQKRFTVDSEVIERVFRATEDTISTLVYTPEKRKPINRIQALNRLFDYLPVKDGLELVLVNKTYHNALREKWIGSKLRTLKQLNTDQTLRQQMWLALVPEVNYML